MRAKYVLQPYVSQQRDVSLIYHFKALLLWVTIKNFSFPRMPIPAW